MIPPEPDTARMERERRERLAAMFSKEDAAALLLLGQANVRYASGATVLQADANHTAIERAVAVLVAGEQWPHLFTPWPEGVPAAYPATFVHGPCYPESRAGAEDLVRFVKDVAGADPARVLVDELTDDLFTLLPSAGDAATLMGTVRSRKTVDEIACTRRAQHINELVMAEVQPLVRGGVHPRALTEEFVARAIDMGAEACVVEPLWQVMPPRMSEGPRTLLGGVAFPLPNDDRPLRPGDVVWVDAGVSFAGYHSDFGRTWTVGVAPDARQVAQYARWREVVDAVTALVTAGSTGGDLCRVASEANGGARPWLPNLYLAHGIGLASAEHPLVGTDLGDAYDDGVVLEEGMVFVLEPVVWDDGAAGYRSEEVLAVTARGCERLSDYSYASFR